MRCHDVWTDTCIILLYMCVTISTTVTTTKYKQKHNLKVLDSPPHVIQQDARPTKTIKLNNFKCHFSKGGLSFTVVFIMLM